MPTRMISALFCSDLETIDPRWLSGDDSVMPPGKEVAEAIQRQLTNSGGDSGPVYEYEDFAWEFYFKKDLRLMLVVQLAPPEPSRPLQFLLDVAIRIPLLHMFSPPARNFRVSKSFSAVTHAMNSLFGVTQQGWFEKKPESNFGFLKQRLRKAFSRN